MILRAEIFLFSKEDTILCDIAKGTEEELKEIVSEIRRELLGFDGPSSNVSIGDNLIMCKKSIEYIGFVTINDPVDDNINPTTGREVFGRTKD